MTPREDVANHDAAAATTWTGVIREEGLKRFPPEKLLPDGQPSYVSSWVYVFGVATIAALAVIVLSGCVLALKGPDWWHTSSVGHFFNSVHFWSVQLFFFCMVVHLLAKFLMGAWRGKRGTTWAMGVAILLISMVTGLTGFVSQQDFASQWIATQAKDGANPTGGGAFFNVLNVGEMLTWHVLLLPMVVGALTLIHILQVRMRGVVPPYDAREDDLGEVAP